MRFTHYREAETYDYQNVYYMREWGERSTAQKLPRRGNLLEGRLNREDYIYLMKDVGEKDFLGKPVGTWFYAKYDSSEFKPLEADAVKEHIHILQESYKLNKGVA